MNTEIANAVNAAGDKAQYDTRVKRLLAQKSILAHILVKTVDEFKGMKSEDVVKYIEGEPSISVVPVEPGLANMEKTDATGQRIVGLNTENAEINEGLVRFDIIFYVRMKNGLSQIIVNIEAQKDEPTEYKILNRAIFYVSRLISSQKERDFVNTNYDDIKQVFSIWICMNMDDNSLSHIHLTKDEMLKPCNWKGNLDLLNIVLMGITNEIPEHDEKYEMHRLIGALLSSELKEQEKSHKAKWQSEKTLVNKIQQNKVEIENLKFEADKAEREGDYGKVAEIRYGKLQALNKEIEDTQKELHMMQGDKAMIKEEVDAEDIADVVSRWTGIPVSKMLQSEKDKLLHLEDELHQRVIGQDEAIEAVADAVRRSRAGLQDPKRPIGSFIFLGTTGVGKTELAKALAEFLFDDESMMTRIDMSEYQEKHSVSRLVGAPPGYVGYDEGGQLTEAIRRKPYSVVLFDEIEKAHPDVFNILLQVLDDGRLTDNKGRVVNFKNTIIIMTSNMGSAYIQSQMEKLNGTNKEQVIEETKKEVMNMLKKTIRPEFLNRIDETIMFLPLTESEIKQIVVLQIKSVQKMLAQNGVELILTEGAIEFLTKVGYDPEFGARPVKRAIQHYLLNDLSKKLLSQEVDRSKPITVDASGERLAFRN